MKGKYFLFALSAAALICVLLLSLGGRDTGKPASGGRKGLISDGSVTLSIFTGGLGNLVNSYEYKDNLFTQRVVDETGINLKVEAATSSDFRQKLNVQLSSGDYPDIVLMDQNNIMTLNDLTYYASQGIIIPLDSYNPTKYPNIAKVFNEFPAVNESLRGADGKLYALPNVNDCLHCRFRGGRGVYYMPFIRDNGRKAPETLDEFTAYLRWVRDNDVNKNGSRNDEIPLAFARDDIKNAISFIAKAYFPFVNTDQYFGLGLINGKVTEQYRANEYREALRYLAGLYKEGLILPDSFTMTREQLRALGENPNVPILATALCAAQNSAAAGGGERWLETFILPVMKGPTGQQNGPNKDPWSIIEAKMFITDKCKNPDAAIALYDYLINTDVMLDGNNGPKGVAWAEPDPGATSLMGGKPVFKALITYGTAPVNSSWYGVSPLIGNTAYRLGEQANDADIAKRWLETGDPSFKARLLPNQSYNEMMNYITTTAQFPYEMPVSYFIPPLAMNETDGARLADINATLNTYKEQAAVEFIVGTRDINNAAAWNAYLADLDRLGSPELASIMQKYIKK